MKSKFLTAAALACAISLAAPGIASAQETSVSASGTTTFCSINGVEVPCGDVDTSARPVFELPDFEMPDFDMPRGDRPDFGRPSFDRPSFDRPSFDGPSFDGPTFEVPDFGLPRAERPIFEVPARPASGDSTSVTVTSSSRAISNGTSTTTSTLCTMNGVEVPCGPGTSATARASFDFSLFGR